MLMQMPKDTDAWAKRNQYMSDRSLTQVMGAEYWYKKFPVTYAEEKLVVRGSTIIPALFDITRDKKLVGVHFYAWVVLGELAPPDYLKELYQVGKQGVLSPAEVSALLTRFLPGGRARQFNHPFAHHVADCRAVVPARYDAARVGDLHDLPRKWTGDAQCFR